MRTDAISSGSIRLMRIAISASLVLVLSAVFSLPAHAHQPVTLLASDTTPSAGPLLVDGTVSFAIRASFSKARQTRAFRAALKAGDQLAVQYLIVDKKPENGLKAGKLPKLVITSPSGKKIVMKLNERSKFYEPYGGTNYLYLGRYSAVAETGTYQFVAKSRARAAITIAVGDREVQGEVRRGAAEATKPDSVAPSPEPSAMQSSAPGYTIERVRENNSESSCWSLIDGNVYNLTNWIKSHPGGRSAILGLCGTDGSSAFNARHRGQSNPTSTLSGYLLGALSK